MKWVRENRIIAGLIALALLVGASQKASAQPNGKVLIVLSSSDHITLKNDKPHPTGYYLSELAIPLRKILSAGYEVVFANPLGNTPAVDKISVNPQDFKSQADFESARSLLRSLPQLQHPRMLVTLFEDELKTFDAVFIPGGHAPMEDLYRDHELGRILTHFHNNGKPTALICHAPISLLSARVPGFSWPYAGYAMTVFSDAEETVVTKSGVLGGELRFFPQDGLQQFNVKIKVGAPWKSNVVVDRELITGQNPQSVEEFSDSLIGALVKQKFAKLPAKQFVGGGRIIEPNTIYSVIGNPQVLKSGYTTVFFGARRAGSTLQAFMSYMTNHVNGCRNAFLPMGLKGYFMMANEWGEMAYLNWDSAEAANRAFQTTQGKALAAQADSLMKTVTFAPVSF